MIVIYGLPTVSYCLKPVVSCSIVKVSILTGDCILVPIHAFLLQFGTGFLFSFDRLSVLFSCS